jgi:hypothetical protein
MGYIGSTMTDATDRSGASQDALNEHATEDVVSDPRAECASRTGNDRDVSLGWTTWLRDFSLDFACLSGGRKSQCIEVG